MCHVPAVVCGTAVACDAADRAAQAARRPAQAALIGRSAIPIHIAYMLNIHYSYYSFAYNII
jgi:hypothetical protein